MLLSTTAAQWPGASLHYRLITGACGGAGNKDIPINPSKIVILGSITPIKSNENGANPSSWTFNIAGNTNVNGVASGSTANNLALSTNNGMQLTQLPKLDLLVGYWIVFLLPVRKQEIKLQQLL